LIATVAVGALVAAQFNTALDRDLAHQPLTAPGRAAVAQVKRLTLGRLFVAGVPRREASTIVATSNQSSLAAFRLGIGVAGGLVILGGIIGAVGSRDPARSSSRALCRRPARGCPLDAAGLTAPKTA
jgi:hypothetical protein